MKQNFEDSLARVLKDEGGYTNDPQDPGGPTNYGITIKDYQLYINPKGTANDVRRMNINDAKKIYKTKYWDALSCDNLASGVDYTCFDYGVNSGIGRPQKCLKRFSSLSGVKLINAINDERTSFLQSLHTFPRFGKGWMRRVAGVRSHSIDLATKQNNVAGPAASTITATLGATLSQFWHSHETAIIIGTVVAAVLVGAIVHIYKNKK
jgi:lysozyme family protein